ncbi:MAG: phospholipase A, partial [Gammaproteobacteria bacterium]|nr:phospholipase A [Gammaproteobacteria bacterium]
MNNNAVCAVSSFGALLFAILTVMVFPVYSESNVKDDCSASLDALDNRICVEKNISKQPFVLIPYKPNYFIGSFVDGLSGGVEDYQNFETKFQISFKIPLSRYGKPARCLWVENTQCITFFGYTQLSVWQMLNFDRSAPFRDTNFEPEI